jgi:hypothetical protein
VLCAAVSTLFASFLPDAGRSVHHRALRTQRRPVVMSPQRSQHHVRCRSWQWHGSVPTMQRPASTWPLAHRCGGRTIHWPLVLRTRSPTPRRGSTHPDMQPTLPVATDSCNETATARASQLVRASSRSTESLKARRASLRRPMSSENLPRNSSTRARRSASLLCN